jgi:hypothetical protein
MRHFSMAKASRGETWKKAVRLRMARWCEQGGRTCEDCRNVPRQCHFWRPGMYISSKALNGCGVSLDLTQLSFKSYHYLPILLV